MKDTGRNILISMALAAVAACGGGSGSGSGAVDTSAAAGLYHGTAGSRSVDGLVLEDGTFWSIYGATVGTAPGGAMQGTGTLDGDNFTAHAKNFYWEGGGVQLSNATISVSYVSGAGFSGTITYANGTSDSVVTTYDPDFEVAPDLASIATYYSGTLYPAGSAADIHVDSSGNLSGQAGTCVFSGTLTPRTVGNVYDVVAVEDQATCGAANRYRGVAYLDRSVKVPVFKLAVLNGQRTKGVLFIGSEML